MTPADFKARRQALFQSQTEAAQHLGLCQQCVSNYETGRRPVPESIVKLLECLEAQRGLTPKNV